LDRIFLGANILFSATYLENSELLSSAYAAEEARRNLVLGRPPAVIRLGRLTPKLTLVNPPGDLKLAAAVRLDSKDRPILLAAIHGKADFLLTGDGRHFDHLYGKHVEGVMVVRPVQYFEDRTRR
jgi:uncharacterized protein